MSGTTFRLVLLVSCAHAMVHVYEQALPSVEQLIGEEFVDAAPATTPAVVASGEAHDVDRSYARGAATTGLLGTVWRVPFGVLALLAGWLTDRFGAKPMLLIYLAGCVATSVLAWWAPSLAVLFVVMFLMGCFASIYHPAGLALISHETTPQNRGAALGWHGIFGSMGIAAAPFLAMAFFAVAGSADGSWRDYYLLLAIPGAVLAVVFVFYLTELHRRATLAGVNTDATMDPEPAFRWGGFLLLVSIGTINGLVYAGFTHFLVRYLGKTPLRWTGVDAASGRAALAAVVLTCGAVGQAWAGRLARPGRLPLLLLVILLANVPCLLWMAVAEGWARLAATGTMALVHFMNQPVYNSMLADYIPRRRRSLGYGFSNMMVFGIGALGPSLVGLVATGAGARHADRWAYATLAALAAAAALLALALLRKERAGRA